MKQERRVDTLTMRPTDPIKLMMSHVFVPKYHGEGSLTKSREQLNTLRQESEILSQINESDLVPYERDSVVVERESRLRKKAEQIAVVKSDLDRQETHVHMAENGYPGQFSLEPLSNGRKDGPAMMIFDIGSSGTVTLNLYFSEWKYKKLRARPSLPKAIFERMKDACVPFAISTRRYSEVVSLSATFSGHTPPEAVNEIRKAEASKLFDSIFIIAEAPAWTEAPAMPVPLNRPTDGGGAIVGGWVAKTQQLFFITAFDAMPIGQFFRDRFAYRMSIPN